ncbi:unnamed protein product [Brassicogethes aeneus]|uniref:Uncharacterized protein n=1 Tax=Brassicogethes aeneus TaxID=1431903 RepID=A0A9P0FJ72_BRAAE|nr:unnamed protein product [Brassicogethes aeneus]
MSCHINETVFTNFNLFILDSKPTKKYNYKDEKNICLASENGEDSSNQESTILSCPIVSCHFKGYLNILQAHLMQKHYSEVVFNKEVTRNCSDKDQQWTMMCFNSVFQCKYYFYEEFVEIFISQIDMQEKTYGYEATMLSNKNCITKTTKCRNFSNSILEKGITFNVSDFVSSNRDIALKIKLRIFVYE